MKPKEILSTSLAIEVKAEVIASNAIEFRRMVQDALANINRTLTTDEEFGDAEVAVKGLKDAESAVVAAKEKALSDAADLHALFTTLDETSEEIRAARLDLERQIKVRKEEVRSALVEEALGSLGIDPLRARQHFLMEITTGIKGKRTLDTMRQGLEMAAAVIRDRIAGAQKVIDAREATMGRVMDRDRLELLPAAEVIAEFRRRDDLAKADAEKAAAIQAAKAAQAEADRLKAEAARASAQAAQEAPQQESGATTAESGWQMSPPKIDSIPTGPSTKAEWMTFEADVLAAFAPLKEARAKLKRQHNIEVAGRFAAAVAAVWTAAKEEARKEESPL